MRQLIIIGIDPCTTLAYAILDLKAKILKIKSTKQHSFSSVISEIINHGIPLLTCCDKNPPSKYAERFATKTGSRLIYPKQDMLVREKDSLTRSYKTTKSGAEGQGPAQNWNQGNSIISKNIVDYKSL